MKQGSEDSLKNFLDIIKKCVIVEGFADRGGVGEMEVSRDH